MHAIHKPNSIIKVGEHFHKQSAKFYLIKFEGKVYEICLFF